MLKKTEMNQIEYLQLLHWLNILTFTKNNRNANNFVNGLQKLFILLFNLLKSLPNINNAFFSVLLLKYDDWIENFI